MLLDQREARFLETNVIVLIDGIETDDVVPLGEQAVAIWKPMKPAAPVTRIRMNLIVAKGK